MPWFVILMERRSVYGGHGCGQIYTAQLFVQRYATQASHSDCEVLKSTHCYKEIEYSKKIKLLNMTSMKYDTRENHLVADDVLLTKMRMKLLE